MSIKVFLRKDVEKIGMMGEIIKVQEGFARNYLIPRGIAYEVTEHNEGFFNKREHVIENRKEVINNQTSMLAEKIGAIELVLARKIHDDGKLYGSISTGEIATGLEQKGFKVSKSQVIINKSIKTKGTYEVTIKLSSRLQPKIKVTIVPE